MMTIKRDGEGEGGRGGGGGGAEKRIKPGRPGSPGYLATLKRRDSYGIKEQRAERSRFVK